LTISISPPVQMPPTQPDKGAPQILARNHLVTNQHANLCNLFSFCMLCLTGSASTGQLPAHHQRRPHVRLLRCRVDDEHVELRHRLRQPEQRTRHQLNRLHPGREAALLDQKHPGTPPGRKLLRPGGLPVPHRLPLRQIRPLQAPDARRCRLPRLSQHLIADGHPPPGRLLLLRPADPDGIGHGIAIRFNPSFLSLSLSLCL